MKISTTSVIVTASGLFLLSGVLSGTAEAQGLLNESGIAILAPTLAPVGGYASNPQEYLSVAWSVVESESGLYTYSYTVQNPAGDVVLNANGSLTSTPEIYDVFSTDFNTSASGAYVTGSLTGGIFQQVNTVNLAWFFNPAVPAGSAGPTVTFQSDLPPGMANSSADGAIPWSSVSPGGQQVPVPDTATPLPEPSTAALFALTPLLHPSFRMRLRRFLRPGENKNF